MTNSPGQTCEDPNFVQSLFHQAYEAFFEIKLIASNWGQIRYTRDILEASKPLNFPTMEA